jgi:hypothetical protein
MDIETVEEVISLYVTDSLSQDRQSTIINIMVEIWNRISN